MDPSYPKTTALDRDPAHPEQTYPGLVVDSGRLLAEGDNWEAPREELCWVCGWDNRAQMMSSYGSRLKIVHYRDNKGLWEIGGRWFLRDEANDHTLGNDYMTQKFLREQPGLDIPLIKEMRRLTDPEDKVHLVLMSRAEGVPLNKIWHTLSQEQKSSYKDQLANVLKQLRKFTLPVPCKVDGSPLDDTIVSQCGQRPTCKKFGSTTDQWFENMAEELRRGLSVIHKTKDLKIIEEKFQELKDNFPEEGPYVLTHGDLHFSNIIVKDDKIQAIIDWEFAGYYPWWAERWISIVLGNVHTDELVYPLWEEVSPEIDRDSFLHEVLRKVSPVITAYKAGDIEHTNFYTEWRRPPFCKCRPYAGGFRWKDLGIQYEHQLPDFDWEKATGTSGVSGPDWGLLERLFNKDTRTT